MKKRSISLALALGFCSLVASGQQWKRPSRVARVLPSVPAFSSFDEQGEDVRKNGADSPGMATPHATLATDAPTFTLSDQTAPSRPQQPIEPAREPRIGSYFYLNYQGGDRLAQPLPYTTLGGFFPQRTIDGVLFGSAQLLVDNEGNPGGGWTLGRRWYQPGVNRVLGVHGSFDLYESQFGNTHHQIEFGVESRGDRWSLFANGFVPTSPDDQLAGLPMFGAPQFNQDHLAADTFDIQESAFKGTEVELSRRLLNSTLWGYGSWYYFDGSDQSLHGYKTGLRGYALDNLSFDVSVADDPVFDTSVFFTVGWSFGGTSGGAIAPYRVSDQLNAPVRRRGIVSIRESVVQTGSVVLTNGGNPITVTHVNDSAAAGASGNFGDPVGSLTEADASNRDIVLLHADSVFNGEDFTLESGQRLLGESSGIVHQINTDQLGLIQLPRATAGVGVPVINNAPGNAITLAANSQVAGLVIQNPAGTAIFGNNAVTGQVMLNDLTINGGGGIQFVNSSADFQLTRIGIDNPFVSGITLADLTGSVAINDGFINGGIGPSVNVQDVAIFLLQNFDITNSASRPLLITATGSNVVNATVSNNRFVGNANASRFGFGANVGAELNLNLFGNEDQVGYELHRDAIGQLRLGGSIGVNNFFNDDNGNVANNGNTTNLGPPNVIISGAGNQIQIIDPAIIPLP